MNHTTPGKSSDTSHSAKDYWRTTSYAYNDARHLCNCDFQIDAAASDYSVSKGFYDYISEDRDALNPNTDWFERGIDPTVWCNPPFSRKVDFLKRAFSESVGGTLICMMIPYEPCTKWWREHVDHKANIVFVPDGRYNFISPETGKEIKGVPFCSCFVVFSGVRTPTQYVNFERGVGNKIKSPN